MKSRWPWLLGGTVALFALAVLMLWLRHRPDPRIEALLDSNSPDAALDAEVILAELALFDDRTIWRLVEEATQGGGREIPQPISGILPESVGAKFAASRSRQEDRQNRALRALALLGARARPFAPQISGLAANQNSGLATWAVVSLAMMHGGDPNSLTNLVPWIGSAGRSERFQLAVLCARLGTNPAPSLLPLLLKPLETSELRQGPERQSAVHAIARYGLVASNAAPLLRQHLADPDKRVRPGAAFALGCVAPEFAEEAVAAMLEQTRTNNAWTGDYAHQLYARLGPAAHAAVPQLEAELTNPRLKMGRGAAAAALWRIRQQATPAMIDALAWDIEHGVQRSRRWSLQALAEIGPPATNAVPALQRMTSHPRVLFRQMARDALKSIAGETSGAR